ncbi:MAG: tripartite tricarboxylate transporter permease, partial [Candidatus Diapherotrites archaeon]|nr:tripartite tricarboxylate transporter permease [Candidatus Diapherotrites archaeon]
MIILYCIAGIIAGIIAGLIPGLHSNNIAIIAAASPIFGNEAMAFMLSMCTVQIFTEFIPSTILGAPSDTTFEAVLPAHKLLLEGKGYDAICHTTFGAIIAIIIGAALSPIIILLLEENATQIIYATPPVLIFALGIFFFESKGTKQ